MWRLDNKWKTNGKADFEFWIFDFECMEFGRGGAGFGASGRGGGAEKAQPARSPRRGASCSDKSAIGEPNASGSLSPRSGRKMKGRGQPALAGRSPCNNKKLNGARGTGDRTKAMSQATALSPTPWALIIFLCQPGLRALTRSYPGLLSFAHSVGSKFRSANASPILRQTRSSRAEQQGAR